VHLDTYTLEEDSLRGFNARDDVSFQCIAGCVADTYGFGVFPLGTHCTYGGSYDICVEYTGYADLADRVSP
jgi:hypothetical protein